MTTCKRIIGISGKIGSGKTTLADFLLNQSDQRVAVVNFADALKRVVADHFSVPLARFYDQAEKNKPISDENSLTVGEALQQVGEERRAQDPDYWLKQMDLAIEKLVNIDVLVVADVRHVNEANWVRERGGLLVRLNGDPADVRKKSLRDHTHASETELDTYRDFDLIINTDTISANETQSIVICAARVW